MEDPRQAVEVDEPSARVGESAGVEAFPTLALPRAGRAEGNQRRRHRVRQLALAQADLLALLVSFFGAAKVLDWSSSSSFSFVAPLFVVSLPLWLLSFKAAGLYDRGDELLTWNSRMELRRVALAAGASTCGFATLVWVTGHSLPARQLLLFLLLALTLDVVGRACTRPVFGRHPMRPDRAVIVGAGSVGQELARQLLKHSEYGIELLGFVDAMPAERGPGLRSLTVLGTEGELTKVVDALDVDRVIVAFSAESSECVAPVVRDVQMRGVRVHLVPRLFDVALGSAAHESIDGTPLIALPRLDGRGSLRPPPNAPVTLLRAHSDSVGAETSSPRRLPAAVAPGRDNFRPRRRLSRRATAYADALGLTVGFALSWIAAFRGGSILWPAMLVGFAAVGLAAYGYRPRLRVQFARESATVMFAVAVGGLVALAVNDMVGADRGGALAAATAIAGGSVLAARAAARLTYRHVGPAASARRTLIVGAGAVGAVIARRLLERPEFGLEPIGFVDPEPLVDGDDILPVLATDWDDIADVLEAERVEHVLVAFSNAQHDSLLRVVDECERQHVSVSVVPRLFEKVTSRLEIEHLGGVPLMTLQPSDPRAALVQVKYALDRALALLLLIVASPLIAAAALATRLTLGSPVFFRQVRVGRDGKQFVMLKFRSMHDGASAGFELPPDTAPGGPEGVDRRTRVGAFLRRTSIDELPQLLNVLRGEMSLVGPRPERPEFASLFDGSVYRYSDRLRMKSGITGWAQIHRLRGPTSISDRAEWDNFYIENWSLGLDLRILLRTILEVVTPPRIH